jgi:hypothetical protein
MAKPACVPVLQSISIDSLWHDVLYYWARAWLNMLSSPGIPERRSLWSALNAPFSPLFPPLITPPSFVPNKSHQTCDSSSQCLTGISLWNDSFMIHLVDLSDHQFLNIQYSTPKNFLRF